MPYLSEQRRKLVPRKRLRPTTQVERTGQNENVENFYDAITSSLSCSQAYVKRQVENPHRNVATLSHHENQEKQHVPYETEQKQTLILKKQQ